MADQFALSYNGTQPNMVKYPLYLQAIGADPAITYAAGDFRALIQALTPYPGVLNADGFVCQQRGAGANFSVDITAGKAIVLGSGSPTQMSFMPKTTGTVNLTTPSAPTSGSPRLHKIVAEILDKQVSGTQYGWQFHLIEDTTGGTLPATPASAIALAQVSIAVGQASVTTANITDLRPMAAMAGAWAPYSAAWNFATGALGSNAVQSGRYFRIGTMVTVQATLVGGTGTSLNTGAVTVTLPFPVQAANTPAFGSNSQITANDMFLGQSYFLVAGNYYELTAVALPNGSTAQILAMDTTPGSNHYRLVTPGTQGLSWTAGSVMNLNLTYECAP